MAFFFLWIVCNIHVVYSIKVIGDIAKSKTKWYVRATLITAMSAWGGFMWVTALLSLSEVVRGFSG